MKTIIEIILDEFRGEVMIIERGADAVWYPVVLTHMKASLKTSERRSEIIFLDLDKKGD